MPKPKLESIVFSAVTAWIMVYIMTLYNTVLATGTYLKGRTIIGTCVEDSGPDGMHAAGPLTDSLLKLGLPLRRFKTGTPPRVNARTVDFDEMEVQPGDEIPVPFSYSTENPVLPQL